MPQTLAEIRALLEQRGLRPKKALGQNFLIDQNLVGKLVDESGVGAGDVVLEIGPGTGTLTGELLDRGCAVVAGELDDELALLLHDRFGSREGFTLVHGDALANKRSISHALRAALDGRPFTLVANLPYHAATPLMLTLMCDHPECVGIYATVQAEVADRLLAGPGGKAYGTISAVTRCVCEARRIADLPAECFWPRPDVRSAMVGLRRRGETLADNPRALADFGQRLFASRRKQLGRVLGRDTAWPEGIDATMRAEQLSPEQIAALCRAVEGG